MATRKTNDAVDLYRKLAKHQRKLDTMEAELSRRVEALDGDDMHDYVAMTTDIDRAVGEFGEASDVLFANAVNRAGLDHSRA